jgi:hypothetical protein
MRENYMKDSKEIIDLEEDLLPEYDLDFSKSKPNRFAHALKNQGNFIQLDPDIVKYFHNAEEVNNALRALINAIPKHRIKTLQKV